MSYASYAKIFKVIASLVQSYIQSFLFFSKKLQWNVYPIYIFIRDAGEIGLLNIFFARQLSLPTSDMFFSLMNLGCIAYC
uniref:Uncharacterized protein n=1 Tax=Arundo donax TaxID=35708 RepID=A0A0A9DW13_ARUDO